MTTFMGVSYYGHGGYAVVVVACVLIMMQFLLVFGRYFSRRLQKVMLEADDWVLLLATAFTVALCAVGITFPRIAGAGKIKSGDIDHDVGESRLVQTSFIAWMVLYGVSVALSKSAILLLYIRVFTTRVRSFTIASAIVGFVVLATGITVVFGSIFQCTPIAYNWDASVGGKCIDKLAFARFTALPNVITGFAMLVMPMPMVWRLNVTIQQKVALTATFLHGIIGFVASVARLAILSDSERSRSMNWLAISWTIWTIVEPANYVIAACLPTLRPIFVRILPASFFLTHKRASKPYSSWKLPWSNRKVPNISLATEDIHGASHITGPWDSSRIYREDTEMGEKFSVEKYDGEAFYEQTKEVPPSPSPSPT